MCVYSKIAATRESRVLALRRGADALALSGQGGFVHCSYNAPGGAPQLYLRLDDKR